MIVFWLCYVHSCPARTMLLTLKINFSLHSMPVLGNLLLIGLDCSQSNIRTYFLTWDSKHLACDN